MLFVARRVGRRGIGRVGGDHRRGRHDTRYLRRRCGDHWRICLGRGRQRGRGISGSGGCGDRLYRGGRGRLHDGVQRFPGSGLRCRSARRTVRDSGGRARARPGRRGSRDISENESRNRNYQQYSQYDGNPAVPTGKGGSAKTYSIQKVRSGAFATDRQQYVFSAKPPAHFLAFDGSRAARTRVVGLTLELAHGRFLEELEYWLSVPCLRTVVASIIALGIDGASHWYGCVLGRLRIASASTSCGQVKERNAARRKEQRE